MMPKLRYRSSEYWRAIIVSSETCYRLPAVVAEGLVGLGHLVNVLAALDGAATIAGGIHQLGSEPLFHCVFVARTRSRDQPAQRQRLAALGPDFDRNLIGRTTDTARADLDRRLDVVERLVEHVHGLALHAVLDTIERAIDDAFGDRLLAVMHQRSEE